MTGPAAFAALLIVVALLLAAACVGKARSYAQDDFDHRERLP